MFIIEWKHRNLYIRVGRYELNYNRADGWTTGRA